MLRKKKLRGPPRVKAASTAAIRGYQVTIEAPDAPVAEVRVNQEALWLARPRREIETLVARTAEAALRRVAEQRALADRAGKAKQLKAGRRARRFGYISKARKLRKKHEGWSLSAIIVQLHRDARREDRKLPSDKTMRRHLNAAGIH
jgi:hypothetical protein